MDSNSKCIAVHGATGHTGRFVVQEARRRGLPVVAVGRSAARLDETTPASIPRRVAELDDPASLEQALESNSTAPVNGLFVGTANAWLTSAVTNQRNSGLSSRYLNQNHKVDAVFYAPEGDMIELHDTANYDLQIFDGGKSIHDEHVVVHYVVLMTPGADRWVVRQLQAVPQF